MNQRVDLRAERKKAKKRKKSFIKSVIILVQFVVILILLVALVVVSIQYNNLYVSVNAGAGDISSQSTDASFDTSSISDSQRAEWMKNEAKQWYLMLLNPDNSVDNAFIRNVDLAEIDTRFTDGKESSKYFDKRAIDALNSICEAALEDGIKLTAISAYRTYAYQQSLFNNRIQRYINSGYSKASAKEAAAKVVAQPGTSEHHMGLAVDFNSVETSFETTNAFNWLQEHAEDYGFIMRYPKDKTNITKIIYEPWHYRYVGVEHAKAINDLDMCLEEYIEYLNNGGKV